MFAATQFLHVTEAGSRAEALEDQIPGFLEVMGDHRTVEDLQASYLTGTVDEMRGAIAELAAAGLQYLILTPLVSDPSQLDLITRLIVEPMLDTG